MNDTERYVMISDYVTLLQSQYAISQSTILLQEKELRRLTDLCDDLSVALRNELQDNEKMRILLLEK